MLCSDTAKHIIGGGSVTRPGASSCHHTAQNKEISINLFEFLGGIISIWAKILAGCVSPSSCLLTKGDSTSATGLLRKLYFSDNSHLLQLQATGHLAFINLDAGLLLHSQWFSEKNTQDERLSLQRHSLIGSGTKLPLLSLHLIAGDSEFGNLSAPPRSDLSSTVSATHQGLARGNPPEAHSGMVAMELVAAGHGDL
jgi:hypothetical protein